MTDSELASGSQSELLEFVRDKINSFIQWDLVRFFHDNPHTNDTIEAIADYVGRDKRSISQALGSLVESGVLTRQSVSDVEIFAMVDDPSTRQHIHEFMEACHDRSFRVQAIQQVIKGMNFSPRHDF